MVFASVILPVLNMGDTIAEQLAALSKQSYDGEWELIISDNGSTDSTLDVCRAWSEHIPLLRIIDASSLRGASATRNLAVREARGSILAFCDADDVVSSDWLQACCTAAHHYDLVAGAIDAFSLNTWGVLPSETSSLHRAPIALSFKPFATGANMVLSRRAFEQVGGFCEDLRFIEDVDMSWRVQLAGYPLHFEPAAVVAKRYPRRLRDVWRKSAEWGDGDIELYLRYRQYGVEFPCGVGPLYSDFRQAFAAHGPWDVRVSRRALVAATGRNYGRVMRWWGSSRRSATAPDSSP